LRYGFGRKAFLQIYLLPRLKVAFLLMLKILPCRSQRFLNRNHHILFVLASSNLCIVLSSNRHLFSSWSSSPLISLSTLFCSATSFELPRWWTSTSITYIIHSCCHISWRSSRIISPMWDICISLNIGRFCNFCLW
jgi:hypothetical protein